MPESPGPVAINHDRLLKNFVALLSADSFHGDEDRVEAIIRPALEPLGIRFSHDAIGNLIGCWPGRGRSDGRIMLNAHMDTVQPTPTMRPVVDASGVRSDGSSVLGADDKAGLAAIIEAIRAVDDAGLDHAPIELVFTVGEDVGHIGSKAFDAASIESRTSFVFDAGGPVGNVGDARAGADSLHGHAARAGGARGDRARARDQRHQLAGAGRGPDAAGTCRRRNDRQHRADRGRAGVEHRGPHGAYRGRGAQSQRGSIGRPDRRDARGRCGRGSGYGRLLRLRGAPLLRRLSTRGGRGGRSARRPRHQGVRAHAAPRQHGRRQRRPRVQSQGHHLGVPGCGATSTSTPPRSSCRTMPYGTSRKWRRNSSRRPEPTARPTTTGASSPRASGRRLGCSG